MATQNIKSTKTTKTTTTTTTAAKKKTLSFGKSKRGSNKCSECGKFKNTRKG